MRIIEMLFEFLGALSIFIYMGCVFTKHKRFWYVAEHSNKIITRIEEYPNGLAYQFDFPDGTASGVLHSKSFQVLFNTHQVRLLW
jgi:hypothetical protein